MNQKERRAVRQIADRLEQCAEELRELTKSHEPLTSVVARLRALPITINDLKEE